MNHFTQLTRYGSFVKIMSSKPVDIECEDGNANKTSICRRPSNGIYRYCILAMLFMSTFVAYVLRVNINIAIIDMLDVPEYVCTNASSR